MNEKYVLSNLECDPNVVKRGWSLLEVWLLHVEKFEVSLYLAWNLGRGGWVEKQ